MKKNGIFLIPILIFLAVSFVGNRLMAAGVLSAKMMIFLIPTAALLMMLFRPKKAVSRPVANVQEKVMGDFAANAFSDDEKRSSAFHSALRDYTGNMPKAAINKLNKLAPQCCTDEEKYAVAMASALCYEADQMYDEALFEYNKAFVLHPTSALSHTIGSLQQRMGELEKARESYEFALELDPENLEARSSMATAWVASRNYGKALDQALMVLEQNESHASALATAAISYGMIGEDVLYAQYTDRAEANGYSRKKIENTVKALKK